MAPHFAMNGLDKAYADASHMDGKGSSTYGAFYDIGTYDPNRSLCSIACGHSIAPECKDEWRPRFEAAANVTGFDGQLRTGSKAYFGKYPDSELYRACSMNAALANKIRRVVPMAML